MGRSREAFTATGRMQPNMLTGGSEWNFGFDVAKALRNGDFLTRRQFKKSVASTQAYRQLEIVIAEG